MDVPLGRGSRADAPLNSNVSVDVPLDGNGSIGASLGSSVRGDAPLPAVNGLKEIVNEIEKASQENDKKEGRIDSSNLLKASSVCENGEKLKDETGLQENGSKALNNSETIKS